MDSMHGKGLNIEQLKITCGRKKILKKLFLLTKESEKLVVFKRMCFKTMEVTAITHKKYLFSEL